MADFAARLRELRKERGLRQIDVAKAFGIAQTTIANYEKKLRFPDEHMLGRIADYFDVNLDFLLGRSALRREIEETAKLERPDAPAIQPAPPETARRYLEVLRRDGSEAAATFIQAMSASGIDVRAIYLEVLEPALKETGRLWELGELSVGEEHEISEATQRIMSHVLPVAGARSRSTRRALVITAPGERHVIGARMVADFLGLDGWNARFPGGNLSTRHVLELLVKRDFDLLAISATLPEHVTEAVELVNAVREKTAGSDLKIIVGGRALAYRSSLWKQIAADGNGENAAAAVETANRLVGRHRGRESR